jgi:hypothetical protein
MLWIPALASCPEFFADFSSRFLYGLLAEYDNPSKPLAGIPAAAATLPGVDCDKDVKPYAPQ